MFLNESNNPLFQQYSITRPKPRNLTLSVANAIKLRMF